MVSTKNATPGSPYALKSMVVPFVNETIFVIAYSLCVPQEFVLLLAQYLPLVFIVVFTVSSLSNTSIDVLKSTKSLFSKSIAVPVANASAGVPATERVLSVIT